MKRNKIIISLVVVIVVVAIGINVINTDKTSDDEVKIGVISILSGEYASFGEPFVNGILLAQEEYTAKTGHQVSIIAEDDEFEAKKGVSAYKKLTSIDDVDAVINMSSPTIGSIYDQVIEDGIPFIQTGEQPVKPTPDNVYQVMPYSVLTAHDLAEELNDNYSADEVAVIYLNEPTYMTFAETFIEGFGSEIKNTEIIDPKINDLRTPALKIIQGEPKIVVFYIGPSHTALLIREIEKIKYETDYAFGLVTISMDDYEEVLGDVNILNGTIAPVFETASDENFIKNYTNRFGETPPWGADFGYDAFQILISTYDSDREDWLENIQDIDIEGVTGGIEFDENGTRAPVYRFGTIENGELPK